MLSFLAMGFWGLKKLPISDMPNVDYPSLYISANFPGASAEVVERDLTSPLEKEFAPIRGIEHLSSLSWQGGCYILVQFSLDKSIDLAVQEVQRAIDRTILPSELLRRPEIHRRSVANSTVLYAVLSSSTQNPQKLYQFAEQHIQKPLSLIEGIGEVRLSQTEPTLDIEVDLERLSARGLIMDDIRRSLEKAGASFPLGTLKGDFQKLGLHISQPLQTKEDLGEVILGEVEGAFIKLKEVASIEEKGRDTDHFRFTSNGESKTGILIEVKKQSGVNVVSLCEKIRNELTSIQKTLSPAHQIKIILDQSVWIEEAVSDLKGNLALALLLVAIVIFLFLGRLSDTLIPCLALPLSLLGTCACMQWLGYSLDILSLLALTLAMGFVVDDAIVVLENIARHREGGKSPFESALIGAKEIGFTILSITLSLVAVFLPLLFMGGILGKLFREFSVTLSLAIILSGFISLTLTPMLCAKLQIHKTKETKPLYHHKWFRFYEPSLSWCLKHPKTTLLTGLASLLCSIWAFKALPVNLLPKEDLGWGFLSIDLPASLPDEEIEKTQILVEKIISEDPSVDCIAAWVNKTNLGLFVKFIDHGKRAHVKMILDSLQEKLEKEPGLSVWTHMQGLISFSLGDSDNKGGLRYTLRSYDLKELRIATEELEKKLKTLPLFEKVYSNLPQPAPRLSILVAAEKAEPLGLSSEGIQKALQTAYMDTTPLVIERSGERIPVRLQLRENQRKNEHSLQKLSLRAPSGAMVPLQAVASWKEELSSPIIQHLFQLPTATISFTLASNASPEEASLILDSLAGEIFSESTRGNLGGEAGSQKKVLADMLLLFFLAVLAMYVILGILYESFIHPLTILSSLPFAGLGAALSLLIFGQPLSLYSFVGIILLVGIVKKNGIMLVDHALQSSKPPEEAIFEACLVRFRPIMMTTLAALMGAIPVAIGLGAGGDTRKGLGIAIAGGLFFSQMLTLYLTPVVYLYFDRFRRKYAQKDQI